MHTRRWAQGAVRSREEEQPRVESTAATIIWPDYTPGASAQEVQPQMTDYETLTANGARPAIQAIAWASPRTPSGFRPIWAPTSAGVPGATGTRAPRHGAAVTGRRRDDVRRGARAGDRAPHHGTHPGCSRGQTAPTARAEGVHRRACQLISEPHTLWGMAKTTSVASAATTTAARPRRAPRPTCKKAITQNTAASSVLLSVRSHP